MDTAHGPTPACSSTRAGALQVDATLHDSMMVVVVRGTLDEVGADALRTVCETALEISADVQVDLAAVDDVNAAGVGELLRAGRAAESAGCGFELVTLSQPVEHLLAIASFDGPTTSFRPTGTER